MTPTAVPSWARTTVTAGALGVVFYVGSWLVAGFLRTDDYDPLRDAISELFAQGAPAGPRGVVTAGLIASGIGLAALGPALHRALPGRERADALVGPAMLVVSGLMTLAAALAFPCSPGCPGLGVTPTDTGHAITAGTGYTMLIVGPLALSWRVRHVAPRLARTGAWVCGVALVGLVLRYFVIDAFGGLQQRAFNTLADAWYVLVAVWVHRHTVTAPQLPVDRSG